MTVAAFPLDLVAESLGLDSFSDDPAERAVEFMSSLPAIHGERAREGKPIGLEPWEETAVREIFGTLKPDGRRQYRTVYIEIPRKNGKTTFCAMLLLYSLLVEREPNGEIYSVAYTAQQAKLVFNAAAKMLAGMDADWIKIDAKPNSDTIVRVSNYYGTIEHLPSGTEYRALAASKAGNYGYNPHLVIFDELHVQKDARLWDVMRTSFGAREEPLMVAITTAGFDKTSICHKIHELAERVISGDVEQDTFLPIIYGADPDDDWRDEETWERANPSLGTIKSIESLREEFSEAEQMPSAQNTFKREHLNIWTSQETAWIKRELWDGCGADYSLADFEGDRCWGGLDLATRFDLCAHVQLFRKNGAWWLFPHFWVPAAVIDERTREHGIPYREWVDEGHMWATPGNVVDYDQVENDLVRLHQDNRYHEIACDDYQAEAVMQRLMDRGVDCVKCPQTYRAMNEPCQEFEGLLISGEIRHPRNPVLDWCIDNVQLKANENQLVRPIRPQHDKRLKIDGVVATIMALSVAMTAGEKVSIYSDPSFDPKDWVL